MVKTPRKQVSEKTYCIRCLKSIAKTTNALQCDGCNLWQHLRCIAGVSQKNYRLACLGVLEILWSCDYCLRNTDVPATTIVTTGATTNTNTTPLPHETCPIENTLNSVSRVETPPLAPPPTGEQLRVMPSRSLGLCRHDDSTLDYSYITNSTCNHRSAISDQDTPAIGDTRAQTIPPTNSKDEQALPSPRNLYADLKPLVSGDHCIVYDSLQSLAYNNTNSASISASTNSSTNHFTPVATFAHPIATSANNIATPTNPPTSLANPSATPVNYMANPITTPVNPIAVSANASISINRDPPPATTDLKTSKAFLNPTNNTPNLHSDIHTSTDINRRTVNNDANRLTLPSISSFNTFNYTTLDEASSQTQLMQGFTDSCSTQYQQESTQFIELTNPYREVYVNDAKSLIDPSEQPCLVENNFRDENSKRDIQQPLGQQVGSAYSIANLLLNNTDNPYPKHLAACDVRNPNSGTPQSLHPLLQAQHGEPMLAHSTSLDYNYADYSPVIANNYTVPTPPCNNADALETITDKSSNSTSKVFLEMQRSEPTSANVSDVQGGSLVDGFHDNCGFDTNNIESRQCPNSQTSVDGNTNGMIKNHLQTDQRAIEDYAADVIGPSNQTKCKSQNLSNYSIISSTSLEQISNQPNNPELTSTSPIAMGVDDSHHKTIDNSTKSPESNLPQGENQHKDISNENIQRKLSLDDSETSETCDTIDHSISNSSIGSLPSTPSARSINSKCDSIGSLPDTPVPSPSTTTSTAATSEIIYSDDTVSGDREYHLLQENYEAVIEGKSDQSTMSDIKSDFDTRDKLSFQDVEAITKSPSSLLDCSSNNGLVNKPIKCIDPPTSTQSPAVKLRFLEVKHTNESKGKLISPLDNHVDAPVAVFDGRNSSDIEKPTINTINDNQNKNYNNDNTTANADNISLNTEQISTNIKNIPLNSDNISANIPVNTATKSNLTDITMNRDNTPLKNNTAISCASLMSNDSSTNTSIIPKDCTSSRNLNVQIPATSVNANSEQKHDDFNEYSTSPDSNNVVNNDATSVKYNYNSVPMDCNVNSDNHPTDSDTSELCSKPGVNSSNASVANLQPLCTPPPRPLHKLISKAYTTGNLLSGELDNVLDPFDDQPSSCVPCNTPPSHKPMYSPHSMSLIYGVSPQPTIPDTSTTSTNKMTSAYTPRNSRSTQLGVSPLARTMPVGASLHSPLVQLAKNATLTHSPQRTTPQRPLSADSSTISSASDILPKLVDIEPILPVNNAATSRTRLSRGKRISISDVPKEQVNRKASTKQRGSPLNKKKLRHSHTTTSLGRVTENISPKMLRKSNQCRDSPKKLSNDNNITSVGCKLSLYNEDLPTINTKNSKELKKSKSTVRKLRHSTYEGVATQHDYNIEKVGKKCKSTSAETTSEHQVTNIDFIGHPLLDDSFHPHSPSRKSVGRQQSTVKILKRRRTIHGPPKSVLIKPRHLRALSTSESNSSNEDQQEKESDSVAIADQAKRSVMNRSKSTKLEYRRSFVKRTDNPLKIIIRRRRDSSSSSNDEIPYSEKESKCEEISESLRLCKIADELTNIPSKLQKSDTIRMIEKDNIFRDINDNENRENLDNTLEYEVSDEEELASHRNKKKIPDILSSPHKRASMIIQQQDSKTLEMIRLLLEKSSIGK